MTVPMSLQKYLVLNRSAAGIGCYRLPLGDFDRGDRTRRGHLLFGALCPSRQIIALEGGQQFFSAVIEPLQGAICALVDDIGSHNRQRNRAVGVANDRVGQLIGVNFAPANGLAGCGTR